MMSSSGGGRFAAEVGMALWADPPSVLFLRRWLRTLRPGHNPLLDGLPWMNFSVIRWLDAYLRPTMDVFEYGSGGSTAFVASRVRRLVSVEHDPPWHASVSRALRERGIRNCDLRLVPPVRRPETADVPYGPGSYTSFAPHTRGYSFEDYVRSIDAFPDGSFDLVIVDGYARPSAVARAIPKVRPMGYLLLDDSDQEYARPALPALNGFPRRDFVAVAAFQRTVQRASIWRIGPRRNPMKPQSRSS